MIQFFIPLIIDLRIRTEIVKTWVNLLELQLLHSIANFVLCCYLSTQILDQDSVVSVGISIINYTWKARAMQFWLSAMKSADSGTKFVAVHTSVCIQPVESMQCLFPSLKFIATYFRFISLFPYLNVLISCLLLIYYTPMKSPILLKFCGVMKCLSKICAAYGKTTQVAIPYTSQLRELTNSYEKYI